MDRYYPDNIKVYPIKEAYIWAKKSDYQNNEEKVYNILTRRKYSFLYIDDIRDIGKKKERVIRGTILDIKQLPLYNVKTFMPSYMATGIDTYNMRTEHKKRPDPELQVNTTVIIVDASGEYESHIEELRVSNILDVNDIDFKYDAEEDTRLVPGYDQKLSIIEKEKWDEVKPQTDPVVVTGERYI